MNIYIYMVFSGEGYYPRGGALDYQGACSTLDLAKRLADDVAASKQHDWQHIAEYDSDSGEIAILEERNQRFAYMPLQGDEEWRPYEDPDTDN